MKVISQYDLTSKLFKQSTSIQYGCDIKATQSCNHYQCRTTNTTPFKLENTESTILDRMLNNK